MLTPGGGGYGVEQPSEDSISSESNITKQKTFNDLKSKKHVRSSGSLSQYRQIQESA